MAKRWMRVNDPGSPLCGWDLLCEEIDPAGIPEGVTPMYDVLAARRVDVLLGDRPLQFNPPNGLGMAIDADRVELCPIQDGVIEVAIDAEGLYGEHLERQSFSNHHMSLEIEIFENAVQVVYTHEHVEAPLTKSWFGPPDYGLINRLEELFDEEDCEGIEAVLCGGNDGRAQA